MLFAQIKVGYLCMVAMFYLFANMLHLDDIWSHNFINAVKSRVFEKDTIYVQYQSAHNM
jgi:hypothetical protein